METDAKLIGEWVLRKSPGSSGLRPPVASVVAFFVVTLVALAVVTRWHLLRPCVSVILFVSWLLYGYFLVAILRPWLRPPVLVVLVIWIACANSDPYK